MPRTTISLDTGTLVIKEAVIGAGPTLRRFKPRAKGSAGPILRRSSHISITLVGSAPEKKKKPPARPPPSRSRRSSRRHRAAEPNKPEPTHL